MNPLIHHSCPKRKEFTQEDFEQYPVWAWDDEMEYKLPISDIELSRDDYGVFFIKAEFTTDGHHFDGYLIGNKTYYAFGIFVNGEEFILNLNMPDRIEIHMKIPNIENMEGSNA